MFRNWARGTFQSLKYPDYRVLWAGSTIAFLAFMMSWIVQSVVAYDLTGKNAAVGIVSVGMGVATIIVSPFGGVIADRVSKKRLLLVGQSLIGLNFAAVGVLIITDAITIPWLVASTFILGTVFAFIGPARQAWIGELLPPGEIGNGIALQQVAMTATRIIGPLIATALIAVSFIGTGGTYIFMGSLFAFVVATLWLLPPTQPRQGPSRSVVNDLGLGLRHIAGRPALGLLVVSFITIVMAGYSYQVILPGLLENELDRSSKDIGLLMMPTAISGLAITVGLAGFASSRHAWRIMLLGGAMLGVGLLVTAAAANFAQAIGAMLLLGAGTGAFQMINNSLVMQESDPAYHGRVMSITMLAWGFNGLVGLPFGALADSTSERTALVVMGVLSLLVTLVTALIHAGIQRRIPAGPLARPVASGD